jgi:hypothetical protein
MWESTTATDAEVRAEGVRLIRETANDPEVGYNRWPLFQSRDRLAGTGPPSCANSPHHDPLSPT